MNFFIDVSAFPLFTSFFCNLLMKSFVALAFVLFALSLHLVGMPITNNFSVARGTSSSASKAISFAVSSGSSFNGDEPVNMSFPSMNKITVFCLDSSKNSDRCRVCIPGCDRILKLGNLSCFN